MAEMKVIIVGKYSVGKTALLTRYTKNRFCEQAPYQAVGIVRALNNFMIYSPNSVICQ